MALSPGRGPVRGNDRAGDDFHLFLFEKVDEAAEVLVEVGEPSWVYHLEALGRQLILEYRRPCRPIRIVGPKPSDNLACLVGVVFPDAHKEVGDGVYGPEGVKRPLIGAACQPCLNRGVQGDTRHLVSFAHCINRVDCVRCVHHDHQVDFVLEDQFGGDFSCFGRIAFGI